MNSPGPVHSLTAENFLTAFPIALQGDQSSAALANVTARLLARRPEEINRLLIYPAIDRLDEQLLDILAYDFKVDWWDADYSLEEKRRTLANSWQVHKLLGTKAAVEMAIRAIYPETMVEEWFEYEGGEPYHFRLRINITSDSGDLARRKRVLERLNFYKNLRSHVDEVKYFLMPEKSWAVAGGLCAGSRQTDRTYIRVPELRKPGGAAAVLAGGGLAGSMERIAVKLDAGVKVPTGRAATGCTAGVFHTYQRFCIGPIGGPCKI